MECDACERLLAKCQEGRLHYALVLVSAKAGDYTPEEVVAASRERDEATLALAFHSVISHGDKIPFDDGGGSG